MWKG
jgi:hypothetical protein